MILNYLLQVVLKITSNNASFILKTKVELHLSCLNMAHFNNCFNFITDLHGANLIFFYLQFPKHAKGVTIISCVTYLEVSRILLDQFSIFMRHDKSKPMYTTQVL